MTKNAKIDHVYFDEKGRKITVLKAESFAGIRDYNKRQKLAEAMKAEEKAQRQRAQESLQAKLRSREEAEALAVSAVLAREAEQAKKLKEQAQKEEELDTLSAMRRRVKQAEKYSADAFTKYDVFPPAQAYSMMSSKELYDAIAEMTERLMAGDRELALISLESTEVASETFCNIADYVLRASEDIPLRFVVKTCIKASIMRLKRFYTAHSIGGTYEEESLIEYSHNSFELEELENGERQQVKRPVEHKVILEAMLEASCTDELDKQIIFEALAGYKQEDIAKHVNLSQVAVYKRQQKIFKRFRELSGQAEQV